MYEMLFLSHYLSLSMHFGIVVEMLDRSNGRTWRCEPLDSVLLWPQTEFLEGSHKLLASILRRSFTFPLHVQSSQQVENLMLIFSVTQGRWGVSTLANQTHTHTHNRTLRCPGLVDETRM